MEQLLGDFGLFFAAALVLLYAAWDNLFPE